MKGTKRPSKRKARQPTRTNAAGKRLMTALDEILEAERTRDFSRMKVRRVIIAEPAVYDAKAVRALRDRLGVSQAFFSHLVGVSVELVESWEQGLRVPKPIARRLLDEISRDPQRWRKMVRRSA